MSAPTGWTPGDLVPLADRFRYMLIFRVITAALVVVFAELTVQHAAGGGVLLPLASAGYLLFSGVTYALWRLVRRRGLFLFGMTLMVDGVFLAWASFGTGDALSPVRLLVLVNVIAVALLASYRTALKLAFWHSMLLCAVLYVEQGGVLKPAPGVTSTAALGWTGLTPFLLMVWVVALATATFSTVNERELRRRRFDLEALARLTSDLETRTSPETVADTLLENVFDTFGFAAGAVLDVSAGQVGLVAARGVDAAGWESTRLGAVRSNSLLQQAWDRRETILVSKLDVVADPWITPLLPQAHNLLLVPMSAEGRCIGMLVAQHSMRSGSRIERRVVSMSERFAAYAGLVLNNARLLEQTRELASTDGLTGLANRRTMEAALEKDLARAARNNEVLSFVLVDIDHFKQVNDQFGHQAGDDVLAQVGRAVAAQSRSFDTAARYGGEELALVLPGCDQAQAIEVAERVRKAVGELETVTRVSISAGVATFPVDATDQASLIRMADEALYDAKEEGRDRVVAPRTQGLAALLMQTPKPSKLHKSA